MICNFYLSVAARKIVCCWDVKQPTNKQTLTGRAKPATRGIGKNRSTWCLRYIEVQRPGPTILFALMHNFVAWQGRGAQRLEELSEHGQDGEAQY